MKRNICLLSWTATGAVLLFSCSALRAQPTPAGKDPVVKVETFDPRPSIAGAVNVIVYPSGVSRAGLLNAGLVQNTWPPAAIKAEPPPPSFDVRLQPVFASVGLVLETNPISRAALIDACVKDAVLTLPTTEVVQTPTAPKAATKLDLSRYRIVDKIPLAPGGSELEGYVYTLGQASKTSFAAFKAGAKTHITYMHMFKQPAEYRGEIVKVHGMLKRVRYIDKPHKLLQNEGINGVYEGYIYDLRQYGPNPVAVVFTELPPGLEVNENLYQEVEFYGYFFKVWEYKSAEIRNGKNVGRYSPVIIGKIMPPPAHIADSDTRGLMSIFLGVLAGTLALALGLAFWYRHNDRRIRARITQRADDFVDPSLEPPADEPYDPNYND